MSNPINDGGSAFPCINPNYDGNWNKETVIQGMTLRDWFASHAPELPNWFYRKEWTEYHVAVKAPELGPTHMKWADINHIESNIDHLTRWKYYYADAMLAARLKTETKS